MICLWSFSHPKSSRLRNERTEPEFCHRTVWKLVFFTFSMKASLVGGTICKFVKDEWPFPFFFTPYKQSCMGHVCAVLYAIAACWNEASGLIMPNFVQIGQGVAEIWPFSFFFTMAVIRHLGFLKVENFNCPYPSESQNASLCQILCR